MFYLVIIILSVLLVLSYRESKKNSDEVRALQTDIGESLAREKALEDEIETLKADLSDLRERT